ncbi:MAG: hypothetical protein KDD62_08600, partial [Bdellovibrionales bacterium]|nr:hypothetical protein [Bdellovibrionales bacterium]
MTHHLTKLTLFLCLSIALACSSGGGDNSKSDETPIPNLAQWEANMITYGELLAARLQDPNYDPEFKLADTYYDAQWTFFQIGDYTGDSRWYTYAQAAELTYRDSYLIPNDAFLPGYWLFPHGLAEDALRTGDEVSKTALNGIATNGAYARDTTDPSETISAEFSRETAYAIHTYLQTERLGAARRERLTLLVDHALGHFDQWFGTRNADYVRPFMVGISAHALIAYYNQVSSDGRILE